MRTLTKLAGLGAAVFAAGALLAPAAGAAENSAPVTQSGGCHLIGPPGGPYLITCSPTTNPPPGGCEIIGPPGGPYLITCHPRPGAPH
jgi:hypothetical protein